MIFEMLLPGILAAVTVYFIIQDEKTYQRWRAGIGPKLSPGWIVWQDKEQPCLKN